MEAWKQNLQIASGDFQREVLPNVSASLPAGEVVSVELEGIASNTWTGTAGVLDRDAGIDYLIRSPSSGVTTLAARVSYSYSSSLAYASFTLGEYELQKRRRELETDEAIGPFFTVQGTVTCPQTGTFVCGAVVETSDLISFVDNFPHLVQARWNATSGRPFNVVWAGDLWDQGFRVDVKVAPDAGRILGWP
jgi:hypothetical protein